MQRITQAQRILQPVVELRGEGVTFAYSVRAPRSKGVIPPSSYKDGGFSTLADCLRDVAKALGGDFKRIYVRLDGHCVGERDIVELHVDPEQVAAALKAECDALDALRKPVAEATARKKTGSVTAG
ncbi:hypothetical protein M2282_002823 [Variovorax boronicumulans]|uniref:hypothetical protein n=1 Tax=Variovorax boronicumulans TaxID=436515 RepID=UPI002476972D|nr:hypothetical protein [Variovorax boronicumulans]MDH6167673.1 hypothetical protein [Variovorax boronicumulans]